MPTAGRVPIVDRDTVPPLNASYSRIDTLNVHAERSLLAPELLSRWRGLPVGWFETGPTAHNRNFLVPHPLLALLDTGVAQARFDWGAGLKA
jgi:hypothetical protein